MGQPGEHQAQAVQKLGHGAKGGAHPGHAGPLVEGQCGGNIADLVHLRLFGLGHPAAGIGGKGLQIAAGALGVEDTQRQRGLAGAGHARNADDLVERHIYVDILQVVHPRAPHPDGGGESGTGFVVHRVSFLWMGSQKAPLQGSRKDHKPRGSNRWCSSWSITACAAGAMGAGTAAGRLR